MQNCFYSAQGEFNCQQNNIEKFYQTTLQQYKCPEPKIGGFLSTNKNKKNCAMVCKDYKEKNYPNCTIINGNVGKTSNCSCNIFADSEDNRKKLVKLQEKNNLYKTF